MSAKILLTPFATYKTVLNMQIKTGKTAIIRGKNIELTSKQLNENQRAQKNAAITQLYMANQKPTPPTPPTGGFAA